MIGGACGDSATQSLLGAYVLGSLDQAESIRRHLTGCRSCRESVTSLRSVAVALKLLRRSEVAGGPNGPAPTTRAGSFGPLPVVPTRCRSDLLAGARDRRRPRLSPPGRRTVGDSGTSEVSGAPEGTPATCPPVRQP
ncbi:zf-HC2 domain-containing protein [Micromonospora sp. Llam0]|uniref:anti-sigma factor family protein n=1 Tax=Micromonospora sp. Llam0 TaxID=2485143 RepID=UPI000F47D681